MGQQFHQQFLGSAPEVGTESVGKKQGYTLRYLFTQGQFCSGLPETDGSQLLLETVFFCSTFFSAAYKLTTTGCQFGNAIKANQWLADYPKAEELKASRNILNIHADILYKAKEVYRRAVGAIIHFGTEQYKSFFAHSEAADIKSVMQNYGKSKEQASGYWYLVM